MRGRAIHSDEPVRCQPLLRPQVWGGRRLHTMLGKTLPTSERYGEAWEVSPLLGNETPIWHSQQPLTELWSAGWGGWTELGLTEPPAFPWLLKWLDVEERLSIQVHPNAEQARRWTGQAAPKEEVWVVLSAEPTAVVWIGWHAGVQPVDVQRALQQGRLVDCLRPYHPQPGDCFHIVPGTVHAAAGGLLFAEVQQPSDITFRLDDWGRVDAQGRTRPLHREQAWDCLRWEACEPRRRFVPSATSTPGCSWARADLLTGTFELRRCLLIESYDDDAHSFSAWMVLRGRVEHRCFWGEYQLKHGDTLLVPRGCRGEWINRGDAEAELLQVCWQPAGMGTTRPTVGLGCSSAPPQAAG
ncbi:MAG: mannose-6-phosphate isomerase [Planctomycetaceae bacterium]|nr:MAG: mannose-6-phosphate isomerase [Planctomycetaceae bacterium]